MLPIPDFPYKRIVLIADVLDETSAKQIQDRVDLEQTDAETLTALVEAIESLGLDVQVYSHPSQLGQNASIHRHDLVLTIFGGTQSRNRMALTPAVSETHGIAFVGPDAYGRIICQDKMVSKDLARQAGFKVPTHRLVRTKFELPLKTLPSPRIVIKPLLEGSSIGLSQLNLTDNLETANDLIRKLISKFNQPVLVEEFVPGKEVSLNFIEIGKDAEWALSEIQVKGNPSYFDNHLFDANEKLFRNLNRSVVTINELLEQHVLSSAKELLSYIGKIGYGRIDGKLCNGEFVFLELTPDAWISPKGAFAASFINLGKTYEQVIANVLRTAI